jgi:hypothetical protein
MSHAFFVWLQISLIMIKKAKWSFIFVLLLLGCREDQDQLSFEQRALSAPVGITETDQNGRVISRDRDDWNPAPLYDTFVEIRPAFPNPTTGERINLEIILSGTHNFRRFDVFFFNARVPPRLISSVQVNANQFVTTIQIDPIALSNNSIYSGAIGIHRIIVYDQQNNIITFGDVRVE